MISTSKQRVALVLLGAISVAAPQLALHAMLCTESVVVQSSQARWMPSIF
jgi:hypothetical protein